MQLPKTCFFSIINIQFKQIFPEVIWSFRIQTYDLSFILNIYRLLTCKAKISVENQQIDQQHPQVSRPNLPMPHLKRQNYKQYSKIWPELETVFLLPFIVITCSVQKTMWFYFHLLQWLKKKLLTCSWTELSWRPSTIGENLSTFLSSAAAVTASNIFSRLREKRIISLRRDI